MDFMCEAEVRAAFLASPPAIQTQILDLTMQIPNWLRDVPNYQVWPNGAGTELVQLIIRGRMPQIERGFGQWTQQSNNTGCDPCEGPDCSYNWTLLGGNGLERKVTTLAERQFRSPDYCIKQIQTTAQFEEMFDQNVKILFKQIEFFKEINIAFNALISLAKKFVIDSDGPKPNTENPYVYPNIGTADISTINIGIFEAFYEYMRRDISAVPYYRQNGAPVYAAAASDQLLQQMWRDNPDLREDIRFSGAANENLLRYNFMSTIRGMFFPTPILYPRRFNRADSGELIEELPFVNGIPMEVGNFSGQNGAYESAEYEEILLHGMYPFTIFYKPTLTTLGHNTSFGPEPSMFNNWEWINPQTVEDPYRRVGFFATAASLGIGSQFSDSIYGIVVKRKTKRYIATFLPNPTCPPIPAECTNSIPATGCPCPLITNITPDPFTANTYVLTVAAPVTVQAEDLLQIGLTTGGYVTGEVVQATEDFKTIQITLPEGTDVTLCSTNFIFCDDTLGCVSDVVDYYVDPADATRLFLILANPIKAVTAADEVTLFYGNGETATATVVGTPDQLTNTWHVDLGGTAFVNRVGGVKAVCVPSTTDATCTDCGCGPTFEQCT